MADGAATDPTPDPILRVTMLGCGGSQGVPSASGDWGDCDPADPRNRRFRVSILIEGKTGPGVVRTLLVDTSPDMREQMLRAGCRHLDGVLFTHAHADHVHGIDDLRSFNRTAQQPIPIWASEETLGEIRQRFGYALQPVPAVGGFYRPALAPHVITGPFDALGLTVIPIQQDHGYSRTLGFRIGDFAYSTDVVRLADDAFDRLAGLDTWILDCASLYPHPTHAHLDLCLDWVARLKPRRTILTHLGPTIDYRTVTARLPPGIELGIDGLQITL